MFALEISVLLSRNARSGVSADVAFFDTVICSPGVSGTISLQKFRDVEMTKEEYDNQCNLPKKTQGPFEIEE